MSKRKLDLCLIDGFGTELWVDQVVNGEIAITEFLLMLVGSYSKVTCVVEATSSYHLAFAETAHAVEPLGLRDEGRQSVPETYRTIKYVARGRWRIDELADALKRSESHLDSLLGGEPNESIGNALKEVHKTFRTTERHFEKELTAATLDELSIRLQSIPGVGPFIAAGVIGEIHAERDGQADQARLALLAV